MPRIVIGISGASGAPVAIEVLKTLKCCKPDWERHLVITNGAMATIRQETDMTPEQVMELADVCYDNLNIGAALASGSFKTEGMLIVPCSMKTVAGITSGYSDNLLLRAADVTLKERRKLVIVPRECPMSTLHLRNLHMLSEYGVIVAPLMMSYYNRPATKADMTRQMAGKLLDCYGIESEDYVRWKGGKIC